MNILITAIGSMSCKAIIDTFQDKHNLNIYGCDINKKNHLVLSSRMKNFYQIPLATSDSYASSIFDICKKNNINLIYPLTDPEVDVFAEKMLDFSQIGVKLAIPNKEAIRICRNKFLLYNRLKSIEGVSLIPTYDNTNVLDSQYRKFPIIAKPANGRSSEGVMKVNDVDLLKYIVSNKPNYVFQEYIAGDIYTVDIIRNRSGSFYALARKEIIRTPNGAGLTVEVINQPTLNSISQIISQELDMEGCFNIEFIFDGKTFYVMDINPRFSAGIAFSKLAGYDFAEQSLNIYLERDILSNPQIRYGLYGKVFHDYFIE